MNKKAQTEDVFADLIPSIILIVIGIFVLYYFSFGYSDEIRENELLTTRISDREAFSIEGMMNHQVEMEGKKYKLIDLIDKYSRTEKLLERMEYEAALETGAKQYLLQAAPRIITCFKITLVIPLKREHPLVDMCELNILKEIRTDESIIPLSDGGYAKMRVQYGEPDI